VWWVDGNGGVRGSKEGRRGEERRGEERGRRRTQSSVVMVDARSRTADGMEASGAERASAQWAIRAAVMVLRHSTRVPKTSKRRAAGGCVVDMVLEMGRDVRFGLCGADF